MFFNKVKPPEYELAKIGLKNVYILVGAGDKLTTTVDLRYLTNSLYCE